jgi:hypothetical protein
MSQPSQALGQASVLREDLSGYVSGESREGCSAASDVKRNGIDVLGGSTGLFDCAPPPPFLRRSAHNDRTGKAASPEKICEICAICGRPWF